MNALLVAGLVAALVVATADAKPVALTAKPWTYPMADGWRFVVSAQPGAAVDSVRDDQSQTQQSFPAGCTIGSPSLGWATGLCGDTWVVADLQRAALRKLNYSREHYNFGAAGSTWVIGSRSSDDYREYRDLFVNWRTGEEIYDVPHSPGVFDLDASVVGPPFALSKGSLVLGISHGLYARSVASTKLRLLYRNHIWVIPSSCGQSEYDCHDIQYGAGVLTWDQAGRACAYVARIHRTGCWPPPSGAFSEYAGHGGDTVWVTHTAQAMYVAVTGGPDEEITSQGWRIDLRPLRGR